MSAADANPIDYRYLRKRLGRFSLLEIPPVLTEPEQAEIRAALQAFNEASDYQTLGICAETRAIAQAAMESYVAALSQPIQLTLNDLSGPVFLKFNTLEGAWYLDCYSGNSRGVLVSFHASEPEFDLLNGTYGPFPFDLFDCKE
ncbi:MAG: DUF1824 family protein [Cyanobacteria bacterium P01_C01_bin.120]